MLVLSRRKDEVVFIGDDVVVSPIGFGADSVRLQILTPAELPLVGPDGSIAVEPLADAAATGGGQICRGQVELRHGEVVQIGPAIRVMVVRLVVTGLRDPNRARLGFTAPPQMPIIRQEARRPEVKDQ